jgi:hypothetical protein
MLPSTFDEKELLTFRQETKAAYSELWITSRQWREAQNALRMVQDRLDTIEKKPANLRAAFRDRNA